MSNNPFSRRRFRHDFVGALPAVGMILGALAGLALGLVNPDASAVAFAGIGIVVGLVLGIFLRWTFRDG
jgi:hypothetical protein